MVRRRTVSAFLTLSLAASSVGLTTVRPVGPSPSGRPPTAAAPALTVSTVIGGLHPPWDLAFTPDGGMLFTERPGPIKFRIAPPAWSASWRPRRRGRARRGRHAGRGGRPGLPDQPAGLHLLHVQPQRRTGRPTGALADERRGDRPDRTGRHRHRPPGQLRTPLRAAGPGSARTAGSGSGTGDAAIPTVPRIPGRWAARCFAWIPTGMGSPGMRPRRSTRGSTTTATATCRASPSARAARRSRSSTAPAAMTRSTGCTPGGTTGGIPGRCPARCSTTNPGR